MVILPNILSPRSKLEDDCPLLPNMSSRSNIFLNCTESRSKKRNPVKIMLSEIGIHQIVKFLGFLIKALVMPFNFEDVSNFSRFGNPSCNHVILLSISKSSLLPPISIFSLYHALIPQKSI